MLLLESAASEQEAAKLCAAQWAARLFPLTHVPTRYVCVIAAGDSKLEVREAGSAGLQAPSSPSAGKLANMIRLTQQHKRKVSPQF